MIKYISATLAGTVALLTAFFTYGYLEQQVLGSAAYADPIFRDLTATSVLIGVIVVKLIHSFLLAYLHERIPRCGSSLWVKVWRYSFLAWALIYIPGLGITAASMNLDQNLILSWAVSGLVQSFVWSFVAIPILYRHSAPDLSCQLNQH